MVYKVCSSNTQVADIVIKTIFVLNKDFFFGKDQNTTFYASNLVM